MHVEVEGLADFVHGPYKVKRGARGPNMPRVVAQELERANLLRIVGEASPPAPQRLVKITRGAITGAIDPGKQMPVGEAPPSSSSPAGQASQAATSSSSDTGGRTRKRKSDRAV